MKQLLEKIRQGHNEAVEGMFRDCSDTIAQLAAACADALNDGHKLLFCGNGGSACDAMHIAGEFVGRFVEDRRALPALALTPDSGILTAVANDYSYEQVFSRQVEALGQKGDVLITLSTSGTSPNVLKALAVGREKGLRTVLFTGEKARGKPQVADFTIIVPSLTTAHVQEAHMIALHGLASLIEAKLFPKN